MPGMIPLFPRFTLAQMNTTIGSGAAPAAPAAPSPAAAPAAAPTAGNAAAPAAQGTAANSATPAAAQGTASKETTGANGATANNQTDVAKPSSGWTSLILIVLMFGVLYLVMFRGQRKDEKKRKQMILELKKGDQVMTIGGMLARVVSIDGDEVVLKIDESANVKATYRKSAIQEVFPDKVDKK